jgi:2-hydroxy-6-oxonona-2,4-dienedioate hydrolase
MMAELTEANTAKSVRTKGWNIHYHEAGQGHPLIMIHGSGPGATGWTNFSQNIEALAAHHRVIALDLPGWGRSDPVDPEQMPVISAGVEAVAQLMDALGIDRAALMGNSLGGAVCLEFAAVHAERLSHMITMGAGFSAFPTVFSPGGLTEGLRIVRETYQDPSPANFKRMVSIFVYDQSFVTDELCEMRSAASQARPHHLHNFLKALNMGMAGLTNALPGQMLMKLATCPAPSLFIHGRDDRVVPLENSLNIVSWVPDSQAHIFNRCGHWVQIEHAKAFNALVTQFLSTKSTD